MIEIGAHLAGRRGQAHGRVGVAHERRVAIDVGVEHDGSHPGVLPGAQRLDRPNAAHGRVAAVHDAEAADRPSRAHARLRAVGIAHAKATNRP